MLSDIFKFEEVNLWVCRWRLSCSFQNVNYVTMSIPSQLRFWDQNLYCLPRPWRPMWYWGRDEHQWTVMNWLWNQSIHRFQKVCNSYEAKGFVNKQSLKIMSWYRYRLLVFDQNLQTEITTPGIMQLCLMLGWWLLMRGEMLRIYWSICDYMPSPGMPCAMMFLFFSPLWRSLTEGRTYRLCIDADGSRSTLQPGDSLVNVFISPLQAQQILPHFIISSLSAPNLGFRWLASPWERSKCNRPRKSAFWKCWSKSTSSPTFAGESALRFHMRCCSSIILRIWRDTERPRQTHHSISIV